MLTHFGFKVWLTFADGFPLPEFGIQVDEANQQVTCWIPSEAGKRFSVRWKNLSHLTDTIGDVYIDGVPVGTLAIALQRMLLVTAIKSDVVTSSTTGRPFAFAEVNDGDEMSDDDTSEVGQIKVVLSTAKMGQRTQHQGSEVQDRAGGGAMKHRVRFGQAEACRQPSMRVAIRQDRIATFIFKYRPSEVLLSKNILSPPQKPALPSEQQLFTLDTDDSPITPPYTSTNSTVATPPTPSSSKKQDAKRERMPPVVIGTKTYNQGLGSTVVQKPQVLVAPLKSKKSKGVAKPSNSPASTPASGVSASSSGIPLRTSAPASQNPLDAVNGSTNTVETNTKPSETPDATITFDVLVTEGVERNEDKVETQTTSSPDPSPPTPPAHSLPSPVASISPTTSPAKPPVLSKTSTEPTPSSPPATPPKSNPIPAVLITPTSLTASPSSKLKESTKKPSESESEEIVESSDGSDDEYVPSQAKKPKGRGRGRKRVVVDFSGKKVDMKLKPKNAQLSSKPSSSSSASSGKEGKVVVKTECISATPALPAQSINPTATEEAVKRLAALWGVRKRPAEQKKAEVVGPVEPKTQGKAVGVEGKDIQMDERVDVATSGEDKGKPMEGIRNEEDQDPGSGGGPVTGEEATNEVMEMEDAAEAELGKGDDVNTERDVVAGKKRKRKAVESDDEDSDDEPQHSTDEDSDSDSGSDTGGIDKKLLLALLAQVEKMSSRKSKKSKKQSSEESGEYKVRKKSKKEDVKVKAKKTKVREERRKART